MKTEYEKITNLLGTTSDKAPRFITKKWVEVHDQSNEIYSTNKQIKFKTSLLQSDLCDYIDSYIVVKRNINVTDPGIASASFSLVFSLTTGIIKKLLSITTNKKKKHNKIVMLTKNKLNCIEIN